MTAFSIRVFKREDGITELDADTDVDGTFEQAKHAAQSYVNYYASKLHEIQGVAPAVHYYPLNDSVLDYVPKKTVNVAYATVKDPHRDSDLVYTFRIIWDNRRTPTP